MDTRPNVVKICFTAEQMKIISKYASHCELGGSSRIFPDAGERQRFLSDNQYIGQAATAALDLYLNGSMDLYIQTRELADKTPWKGDGGVDLIGTNLDVKCSRMRCGLNFLYHLYIRNREFHPENCYWLALMPEGQNDCVYLVGFCDGSYDDGTGRKILIPPDPKNPDRHSLREDKLNSPQSFFGIGSKETELRELFGTG